MVYDSPGVCLRNTSQNDTIWMVFPRPMAWARMQPKPWLWSNLSVDSMMLSYRKRMPPILSRKHSHWSS